MLLFFFFPSFILTSFSVSEFISEFLDVAIPTSSGKSLESLLVPHSKPAKSETLGREVGDPTISIFTRPEGNSDGVLEF